MNQQSHSKPFQQRNWPDSGRIRVGRAGSAGGERRAAPYARQLREILKRPASWPAYWGTSPDGRALTVWVLAGPDAWAAARSRWKAGRICLVSPPDDDPAALDWTALQRLDPVLVQPCGPVGGDELQRLVLALVRDGVRHVLFLGANGAVRYSAGHAVEVNHAA